MGRAVLPMGVLAAKLWAGPKQALQAKQAEADLLSGPVGPAAGLWRLVSMEPDWLAARPRPHLRPRGLSLSLLESISPASSPTTPTASPSSPISLPNTPPSSPRAKDYLTRLLK